MEKCYIKKSVKIVQSYESEPDADGGKELLSKEISLKKGTIGVVREKGRKLTLVSIEGIDGVDETILGKKYPFKCLVEVPKKYIKFIKGVKK